MIDGKPAIAVIGPDRDGLAPALIEIAKGVTRELVSSGYAVITRSGAGVSKAVVERGMAAKGTVVAVSAGGMPNGDLPQGTTLIEKSGPLTALEAILERADAAIVLAPDVDSLSLLCQIWAFGASPQAPYRPVVLLGSHWRNTVKVLADAAELDARTRAMVTFAETPEEAVEALRYYVSPG